MRVKGDWHENRCFGSTIVGPRGQAVIPANARKELGINTGDTLLVFRAFHDQGLVLLKAGAVEQMLSEMSERLTRFEKQVKDYRSPQAASGEEGGD